MSGTEFNECSASELMQMLVHRGYFHHGGAGPVRELDSLLADSIDAMQKPRPPAFSIDDCDIVPTHDSRYLTLNALTQQLHAILEESGGRLSKTEASMALAVNVASINRVLPENITVLGDELMTEQYFDEQMGVISSRLAQSDTGCLALSEIASQLLHLPTEFVLSACQTRIDGLNARLVTLHGAKTLVTPFFDARERVRIRGALRALTGPTQMDALSLGDMAYVLPVVRELCDSHEVDGVLREQSGSHGMYTPRSYEALQRRSVDELFQMQGYVTLESCKALGVPSSSMATFVTTSFPSAVCLTNSVIASNVVIEPLVAVIQECLEESSFVDLKLHVAEALLIDIRELINGYVLPQLPRTNNSGGELVLSPGEAWFVSQAMIRRLSTRILPPLIESFAKRRAMELDQGANLGDANDEHDMKGAQKGKKKSKNSSAHSKSSAAMKHHTSLDIVPLSTVSNKVAEEEPDLGRIQKSQGPSSNEEEFHPWEQDEAIESGPLQAFCRIAFFTDDFRKSCARAVEAELELLRSSKKAISVRSRKDGAARTRSIESSFEDPSCFNAACFQLQVHAKFLDYLATTEIDDDALSAAKQLFLDGCCANFAHRITQYCLFRNEVEEGLFVFETSKEQVKEDDVSTGLPSYCREADITQMHFPTPVLRCFEDEDGKFNDPLATLRAVLPGNLGVTLARAWTLCGGKCHDAGVTKPSVDADFVPPGDAEGFMAHIEDNCLSICGIPFKKLDKKCEKQYLSSRRQELTTRLKAAVDADKVLELTVLLLFQQVKSVCAFGLPVNSLLPILCKEKKISDIVAKELTTLEVAIRMVGEHVVSDTAYLSTLVEKVRACGLCKDICKHQVDPS